MAFFANNETNDRNDDRQAMLLQHSGRTAGIFKRSPFQPAVAPGSAGEDGKVGLQGQFLNTMDGDLTAGLERYLPTLSFRLQVAHQRLAQEIGALKKQLEQYERLSDRTPEMAARIKRLRQRLITLEYRERRVNKELGRILTLGNFLANLFHYFKQSQGQWPQWWQKARDWLAARIHGQAYVSATHATQELKSLQQVFSNRLSDPNASSTELARIISQYDRIYEKARRDMNTVVHAKDAKKEPSQIEQQISALFISKKEKQNDSPA
jgi:hypothetical protein